MKDRSITNVIRCSGGTVVRGEFDESVQEAAKKLQKRVVQRAEEYESSGDPADVVARAALTKCGSQRVGLQAAVYAFFHIRDGRCGPEKMPPRSPAEIGAVIDEVQPVIEMFERDLLEILSMAIVEHRAQRKAA